MAHGQGSVPILTKWTRITGWSQTFCLLSTPSSSVKGAVKTCAYDDVDDVSCKYWVVTILINLPRISLLGLGLSGIVSF